MFCMPVTSMTRRSKPSPNPSGDGSVAPQVEIPAVGIDVHMELVHPGEELVVVAFPFASAAEFADSGNEKIDCRDGLSVIVLLHVEGLYLLGIVRQEDRTLVDDLRQIFFVLASEVQAEGEVIDLEMVALFLGFLEFFQGFRVGDPAERLLDEFVEPVDQAFIDPFPGRRRYRPGTAPSSWRRHT